MNVKYIILPFVLQTDWNLRPGILESAEHFVVNFHFINYKGTYFIYWVHEYFHFVNHWFCLIYDFVL